MKMKPDLFTKTDFIHRKGSMTIQDVVYDRVKIYFIEKGELKAYAIETTVKRTARKEFDEKVDAVKSYIKEINDDREFVADRNVPVEDIETINNFFTEANETYTKEAFRARTMKIAQTQKKLDEKMEEYQNDEKEAQVEKCKQVSDKIRVELQWKEPKYKPIEAQKGQTLLDRMRSAKFQLERFREWLKGRFPAIAALVAFTAGVFSIVFAVLRLTRGTAVPTAKTTHSIGKTVGRILGKFGPMMFYLSVEFLSTRNNVDSK